MTFVPDHVPECVAECGRDKKNGERFQEVGQRGRILEWMRGIDIEKASAVRAELFNGYL